VSWPPAPPVGEGPAGAAEPKDTGRRGARWWITATALLVAAAATLGLGLRGYQRALPGPVDTASGPAGGPRVSPAARSLPVTLSIPAIGLKVPLSALGLNPNGTVEVPTNFQEPGWYRFGPSPGQLGSAVILGHVDSYLGPAVFFRLRTLRPGDQVKVALADGVTTHFLVRQVAMYSKTQFPTLLVYGSHGYSALQLVTCGGVFDTQTRHYLSNVVVYTRLVATTEPRSSA
jgi:sortase (surface protein transpeptidase)